MSDDKTRTGGQDRRRINVNEDYELRDWAKSLDTEPQKIVAAVSAVGDEVAKVRAYLEKNRQA